MIYLEHDDGHNDPSIDSYESVEEAVRCIVGEPPKRDRKRNKYKDGWVIPSDEPYYVDDGIETADQRFQRDMRWHEEELAELMTLLVPEDHPDAQWSAMVNCDEYRRVDAREMEHRAEKAKMQSVAMRKGIKAP